MKFKILFCGTPEFAVPSLRALAKDTDFEIVQVISQPDRPAGRGYKLQPSPIKVEAVALGLSVITPENINSPEVIASLQKMNLDAIVVVAYGQILKNEFLKICPQKNVNLHGSLLPRWRGAAPIQRALMFGDSISGVSLQVIVRKLDAGPVIAEKKINLSQNLTAAELHDQLALDGAQLLTQEFKQFLRGEIASVVQDETRVTVAEKISKEETRINWSESALQIHNRVRGLVLGPQAWSQCGGVAFKIHQTKIGRGCAAPGTILQASKTVLEVACGENSIEILVIQPESKKKMPIEEFLKGSTLKMGDCFVSKT